MAEWIQVISMKGKQRSWTQFAVLTSASSLALGLLICTGALPRILYLLFSYDAVNEPRVNYVFGSDSARRARDRENSLLGGHDAPHPLLP
jgi:hypothetical protein